MQKKLIAVAVATLASAGAHAAFDANIEFDNLYQNRDSIVIDNAGGLFSGVNTAPKGISQSGRVEMNASGKVGTDMFIAGRASLIMGKNGGASTDDMWVQLGNSFVDVKLGRFEAADLFPIPRDAYIPIANYDESRQVTVTAPVFSIDPTTGTIVSTSATTTTTPITAAGAVYRGSFLRGRFGDDRFHGALTFNVGNGLSAELGMVASDKERGNVTGFRPVVTYTAGPLMVRGGYESFKLGDSKNASGYGLTGSYDLGGITLSANYASATLDWVDGRDSTTYGLFVNTAMGIAAGWIESEDSGGTNSAALGNFKTRTLYAAYTMPLFDLKGASMTTGIATSQGSGSNNADTINGIKVRFNYAF